MPLGELAQPLFGNFGFDAFHIDDALEVGRKHAIVAVEVFFILHQAGARKMIKIFDAAKNHLFFKSLQQHQELLDGDWHAAFFQFQEKFYKHMFLKDNFSHKNLQLVTCFLFCNRHYTAPQLEFRLKPQGISRAR